MIYFQFQIQMVALQWLVANEEAFTPKYIDTTVLERLIRNSAKRVCILQKSNVLSEINPGRHFDSSRDGQ